MSSLLSSRIVEITRQSLSRCSSSAACAVTTGLDKNNHRPDWSAKPWRISAAVTVERMPRITPDLTPLEEKMTKMLEQIEFENSKKSDHELRLEETDKIAERIKLGEKVATEVITAYDDEERWRKDAEKFQAASRSTEADAKDDKRSLDRALDKSLFLVLKQRESWTLPMTPNQEGESLRQTAERALRIHCGDKLESQVLGNAPFAHFKLKYSKKYQEHTGSRGEKVFLYKALFKDGQVSSSSEDYHWLRRDELYELVDPKLKKPLFSILYDED